MEFLKRGKLSKADFPLVSSRRKRWLAVSQREHGKNKNVADYLSAIRSLPRYEEGRLRRTCTLGSGTSFLVEKADDEETGTVVVIKTSKLLVQNTPEASTKIINDTILRELKISTHVPLKGHRNITQTLGFELESTLNNEPILSLVVEYAQEGSLSHYFEKFESLTLSGDWKQRMAFALDVASALEALHSGRIVHGDIKPDNVLIFRNEDYGQPLMAKLSDFGSAIVEDTLFPRKENIAPQVYHGTLLYVPPLVRQAGLLPFQILPACDNFSFGLLLWSIFKGRSYFDSSWKQSPQSDREFLDEIGVDGLIQRFHAYLEEYNNIIPVEIKNALENTFLGSVVDVTRRSSPQLVPSARDRVLKTAFSRIRHIKSMLIAGTDHEQRLSNQSKSIWETFHMDDVVIDGKNETQWHMQCQLLQHYLMIIENPYYSAFEKGKVALRLSSYYAVGVGSKRDLSKALDLLLTAAAFKDASAQAVCHRVFEAHARPPPVLRPDLLPACSVADSDDSERTNSEMDTEDSDDWRSTDGDQDLQETEISALNQGLDEEEQFQIGLTTNERDSDMMSYTSDSESDLDYPLFRLIGAMDQKFKSMMENEELSSNDYYSWHIRSFEKALGEANGVAPIHAYGKEYAGIEALPLADICERWSPANVLPTIEIKVEDGSLLEQPLLHHAIASCKLDMVERLLKLGISPQTQDDSGNTALHIACQHGYSDITKLLIDAKAKASIGNHTGSFPLHWLWMFEDSDIGQIAELLVNNAEANVNATMKASESTVDAFFFYTISGTPLHSAISVRNAKAVQVLIGMGANVNIRPSENGETPLELAAMLHLSDIAEILLRHGANLLDERNDGPWALHHVGRHVQPLRRWLLHGADYRDAASTIIQHLVNAARRAGLDPEHRDEDGQTAFQCSIEEPGEDDYVVDAFLTHGFPLPPNAIELAVNSCTMNQENAAKVELLLNRKASLNLTNPNGHNVLHTCALVGATRAAYVIANHPEGKCFLNVPDADGDTPLHYTVLESEVATAKVLVEAGAEINTLNRYHMSALGSAVTEKSREVASYLLDQHSDIWLRGGDWMGCNILVLAVAKNLDSSNHMLSFLLSTDLIDSEEDDNDDLDVDDYSDGNEERPSRRRFPQLHDTAVLDAVSVKDGNTALHRAAFLSDYIGVFSLISAGASAGIPNHAGLTAQQEAENQLNRLRAANEDQQEQTLQEQNLRKIIAYLR